MVFSPRPALAIRWRTPPDAWATSAQSFSAISLRQDNTRARRSRKREFDATIPIELLAEAAVHRGQGRLLFDAIARGPVESIVLDAVREGGLDGIIRECDQVEIGRP